MTEIWKPVLGYEGQYEVSNKGRVRSHVAKRPLHILSQYRRKDGYLQVQLKVNQKPNNRLVHTLVDEAFNGPRVSGFEVNHVDGNKANNLIENLERITHQQNAAHAHQSGLVGDRKGEANSFAKLTAEKVRRIRAEMFAAKSPSGYVRRGARAEIAGRYGIAPRTVSGLMDGTNWRHLDE